MGGVPEGLRWLTGGLLALFAVVTVLANFAGLLVRFIQKQRVSGVPFGMALVVGSLALVVLPVSLPAGAVLCIMIGLFVSDFAGRVWPASLVDAPRREDVPTGDG